MDMESRLVFARGVEKGMDREFGVGRYKLLPLERMGNGVLLYSMVTQLHIHVHILISHIIMLHYK